MTITNPAAVITDTGVTAPTFPEILDYFQQKYLSIYGSDTNIDADTQDGQWIGVMALAVYNCNQSVVAAYNSFSPSMAQGAGLSNLVKINGLQRQVPSNSQAIVTLVGVFGTTILNGQIGDDLNLNTVWNLPASVTIPVSGSIDVTSTCTTLGATSMPAGHLVKILTPTRNWQSVTNVLAATAGNPVEMDATLRQRQTQSTSLPALTPLGAIYAEIATLPGVSRLHVYQNDEDTTDADGIGAHSVAAVVLGGDAITVCQAIAIKKSPGTGTTGSVSEVIIDPHGVPDTIRYSPLTVIQLDVGITIKALTGFTSTTEPLIAASVAAFVSGLDIGEDSYYLRLVAPANLSGDAATMATGLSQAQLDTLASTYTVTAVTQAKHSNVQSAQNITISYDEAAACVVANTVITVV